ncbi:hypothetical protein CAPTEDRAFT_229368 [Capitella teleta]|uniref:Uncharacterized protein n=1 Tax=Capitella teleta TaxID=283909 RepID=R7V1R3_CAPTE|nr:hypothetical protein CAPTEDRAFT_229368 [Capitella teleta]|eukprot:ELU09601.1 hypothetical protein CAPTEDRAFT_229368 [Capitella teleta]
MSIILWFNRRLKLVIKSSVFIQIYQRSRSLILCSVATETKRLKMSLAIPGAVFQHYGPVPSSAYVVDDFKDPLEEAVYKNDLDLAKKLIEEGNKVTVGLKIGEMSCLEYCCMMGYANMLRFLMEQSDNYEMLKKYFSFEDVVERAYLISKHKKVFFAQDGLAEANRYEAALYTAVEYNQPECLDIMLEILGSREPAPQSFYTQVKSPDAKLDKFSALQLAEQRGHKKCQELLSRRRTTSNCT